jgi:hypothetical protein
MLDSLAEWCVATDEKPIIRGCSINDNLPSLDSLEASPEVRITRRQSPSGFDSGDWVGFRLLLDTELEFAREKKANKSP